MRSELRDNINSGHLCFDSSEAEPDGSTCSGGLVVCGVVVFVGSCPAWSYDPRRVPSRIYRGDPTTHWRRL